MTRSEGSYTAKVHTTRACDVIMHSMALQVEDDAQRDVWMTLYWLSILLLFKCTKPDAYVSQDTMVKTEITINLSYIYFHLSFSYYTAL